MQGPPPLTPTTQPGLAQAGTVATAPGAATGKLQDLLADSERALEECVQALSSRHRKYMAELLILHGGSSQYGQHLAAAEAVVPFAFPSALTPLEKSKMAAHQDLADLKSLQTAGCIDTLAHSLRNSEQLDSTTASVLSTEEALTEPVFKDSLFMALAPLYELKQSFSEGIGQLNSTVNRLSESFLDFKKEQQSTNKNELQSLKSLQDLIIEPQMKMRSHSSGIEGDDSKEPNAVSVQVGGLARGVSHLNFASDLLDGYDEPMELLSSMYSREMPGIGKRSALFPSFGAEPERESRLAKLLQSENFERVVSLLILLNICLITYATDYAVRNPTAQDNSFIQVAETTFQTCYLIELGLKLMVHRHYFFIGHEWHWNWLDFLLVCTAAYDLLITTSGVGSCSSEQSSRCNLTFLRVVRLVRFSRVIRVFRVVRFVNELHVLLRVIYSSLKPLFWCMVMLVVFFYIFAVVFVNAAASYLADPSGDKSNATDIKVKRHFGSVSRAMITLYKATTGGQDWGDVSDTLFDCGKFYYCLFLFFIAFIILALLNILTGIFVDRAMKATAEDKDGEALAKLTSDRATIIDLCRLHCVISGKEIEDRAKITGQQFEDSMKSAAMRARFSVLGLEIWDSKGFFSLLEKLGGSEYVDLHTFVAGCMQMRGAAQSLGIQVVSKQVHGLSRILKQVMAERSQAPALRSSRTVIADGVVFADEYESVEAV